MQQLSDMRDSIKELAVQLPVGEVTPELIRGLTQSVQESKGETIFRLHVYDPKSNISVRLYSKTHKVGRTQPLISYLEDNDIKYSIA